ncbi:hypothetical protein F2Q68_00015062 [Brassica cretica]|uniref:Uncharacterized protein n=1 Tax=Brassica cretica TaxID=69181 RepID=A0A8S9HU15_BRACR|nr:hypothetical protein F2Q68_00015062 [Brassica cretica]
MQKRSQISLIFNALFQTSKFLDPSLPSDFSKPLDCHETLHIASECPQTIRTDYTENQFPFAQTSG